ncbi:hypothetical protein EDB82DRAFT_47573 [Fusarium venenatum]|uniref:uncharacterized protein n=1 Tax=Fusarium venenatum TaxID=56646 RepID=UPI001E109F9A|nr:hypothetical protein EDB82DRAFT_47573 [Fusarium venenatum]
MTARIFSFFILSFVHPLGLEPPWSSSVQDRLVPSLVSPVLPSVCPLRWMIGAGWRMQETKPKPLKCDSLTSPAAWFSPYNLYWHICTLAWLSSIRLCPLRPSLPP